MSEKRIFKRRQLIYYLEVKDADTDKLIGHVVDLTPEGLMVMSEVPLTINKMYCFKIPLKKMLSARGFLLVQAKSRWCTKDMHANFYDTGFELRNVDQELIKEIACLIETLCF
ncbi:MAG: hypothetical protein WCQ99_05895 [Pseudomonadota bacterium]